MNLLALSVCQTPAAKGSGGPGKRRSASAIGSVASSSWLAKKCSRRPRFVLPLEAMHAGKVPLAGALRLEAKPGRPAGSRGRKQRDPGR